MPESGMQVRVWLPDGVFDLLKGRAARHGTNVAAEARRVMRQGIVAADSLDDLAARLDRLESFLHQHLEVLLFCAATDAAYGSVAWRRQYELAPAYAARAAELDQENRRQAADRIRRALRLGLGAGDEAGGEGEMANDSEDQ